MQSAKRTDVGAPEGSTASAVKVARGGTPPSVTTSSAGSARTARTRSLTTSDCFSRSVAHPAQASETISAARIRTIP